MPASFHEALSVRLAPHEHPGLDHRIRPAGVGLEPVMPPAQRGQIARAGVPTGAVGERAGPDHPDMVSVGLPVVAFLQPTVFPRTGSREM